MRLTKPIIGSRVVCHKPTILQSWTAVVGLIRLATQSCSNFHNSRARSAPSMCGYSLKQISKSADWRIRSVKWQ